MEKPFEVYYGKDQEKLIDKLIEDFQVEYPGKLLSYKKRPDEIEKDGELYVKYRMVFSDYSGPYYWGFFQGSQTRDIKYVLTNM